MQRSKRTDQAENAELIAAQALGFIGGEAVLLDRFLALSGISASGIRRAAAEPGFLAGVLEFLLAHEPDLLTFAAASGHRPAAIAAAHAQLAGRASA